MLHRVLQLLDAEDIDVKMVRALIEIAVQHADEIFLSLVLAVSERVRMDRLRVGDAVQRPCVRKLRHAVEGGEQSVLLRSVRRIRTR